MTPGSKKKDTKLPAVIPLAEARTFLSRIAVGRVYLKILGYCRRRFR